jgi:hypothetical protein
MSGTFAKITSPIYEYCCQEANYGIPDILSRARVEEQNARNWFLRRYPVSAPKLGRFRKVQFHG